MISRQRFFETTMGILLKTATFFSVGALIYILVFIFVKGIPHLRPQLFALTYTSENVSLLPALLTTVLITFAALLIAVPLGLGTAIYLVEYAKRGSKIVLLVQIAAETLAGIPSIIYGLFGLLFFVTFLGWGFSFLAGSLTLALMTLPLVMRSCEEALLGVPDTYRQASFGLGAGRLRTILKIVLPHARPGIFTGIMLSMGRIVGETAALIYTAGTVAQIPRNPMMSSRTLSVHMYALSNEGLHMQEGYATAVVLMVLTMCINRIYTRFAMKKGETTR